MTDRNTGTCLLNHTKYSIMGQHSNIVSRPNYKIQANADYNVRRKNLNTQHRL